MSRALIVLLASTVLAAAPSPRLGSVKELFLDDELIESAHNLRRVIHQATKYPGNPVLPEGTIYGSVLPDQGRFRMWYVCPAGVCYAESPDGIRWTKPALDIVRLDGKPTNILIRRQQRGGTSPSADAAFPYYYEMFGVHRDDREKDASRRYKMGFLNIDFRYSGPSEDPFHKGQRRALGVAASPDGIHWRAIDHWATDAICDGETHWMWDPSRSRWVLYGRTKFASPELSAAWGLTGLPSAAMAPEVHAWIKQNFWGRAVARIESEDFLKWNITGPGKAPVVLASDVFDQPPGTEIYGMNVFPYESVYIGLVKVWHRAPEGGSLDTDLAVSRDTVNFTRVGDRSPFIPVGGIGEWDRFNNSLPTNPPILVGDELRFYYAGTVSRHSPYRGQDTSQGSGIGFATIRKDRFVSLAASFDGGSILTRPLSLAGSDLRINAKSDFGEIVVELIGEAGKAVGVSHPVRKDALDIPVEWRDIDVNALAAPVRLKITLKNAHLFAVWCR